MASFVPVRTFFGKQLFSPATLSARYLASRCTVSSVQASLSSRERRRAAGYARGRAHRDIKKQLETNREHLRNGVVTVPSHVRERCKLTPKMARVKIFFAADDLEDITAFKGIVRSGLVRLFPELEQRGLLRETDGFDLRIGGGGFVHDSAGLKDWMERCDTAGSPLYVEIIPHNTPPPKPPLSKRVEEVQAKARNASLDPDMKLHMISFYKFVDIARPDTLSSILSKVWSKMGVKGRVYVAKEGINAQLAVPDATFADFRDAMNGSWMERGETFVPSEITGVFLNVDNTVHHSDQPFEKLHVRPREKILADGFDDPLDWSKSGKEVPPREWHEILHSKAEDVVLLDCRNEYESNVGRFEGAEPLNTKTFRESWGELERRLQNEDRGKRILTYCTGGIRCVKVNAFLEQKMGFYNTGRLEGGIVSYARTLRESGKIKESAFKGVNHVFDGRMGEVVTEDLLHRCINCNQPCNIQTDCANIECPRSFDARMFVQCEECTVRLAGACSEDCKRVQRRTGLLRERKPETATEESSRGGRFLEASNSERYADAFSSAEQPLLHELRIRTESEFPRRAHMMSSHSQASLLRLLVQIAGATRALEIGTFTGYATLAIASALPEDGYIVTCELDEAAATIAQTFFDRDGRHGAKIDLHRGRGLDTLQDLHASNCAPFDLVFVDANKGAYKEYTEFILERDLLKHSGLIVFDNVLFRGEVAGIWSSEQIPECETEDQSIARMRLNNLENVRRTAQKLHTFNQYLKEETRLEQTILPFRDGLTIARRVR